MEHLWHIEPSTTGGEEGPTRHGQCLPLVKLMRRKGGLLGIGWDSLIDCPLEDAPFSACDTGFCLDSQQSRTLTKGETEDIYSDVVGSCFEVGDSQYFSARKAATPALIHLSTTWSVFTSIYSTKFVECPVVSRVPFRDTTL